MVVVSMSPCSNHVNASRLLTIFLLCLTLYLSRDFWLPTTSLVSLNSSEQQPSTDPGIDPGWEPIPIPDVTPETQPTSVEKQSTAETEKQFTAETEKQSTAEKQSTTEFEHIDDTTAPVPSSKPVAELAGQHDICESAPTADNVMVVLKTGATEIYQKLPTHFLTILKCTPQWLIWSDLEQTFSDYRIYDAINSVSSKIKDTHPDFELYRKQQDYKREGEDIGKLQGDKGWDLDKWKFMPMFIRSYEMAPETIDWFVYVEADTSLSWVNLLLWLKRMDPKDEFYLGAQNVIGGVTFGHGGSGIVVSRGAAERLAKFRDEKGAEEYDKKWEAVTSRSCCGDEVIARAFLEAGVPLTHAWPRLQGEKINLVDWTETHWCAPSMTWHHVTPGDLDSLWHFQSNWVREHGWDTPYLYKDLFETYVKKQISVNRTSWNNLSKDRVMVNPKYGESKHWASFEDWERKATESFEACGDACVIEGDSCIQWMWQPGRCYLGEQIRLGNLDGEYEEDEEDEEHRERWNSGWRQDRIEELIREREPCDEINWGPTKPGL